MARILVADDDPPIRHMVRLACERVGHQVFEAIDTQTAVQAYTRLQPDLLILDIGMPGGGGPFVLNSLRFGGTRKTCPVLVISGSMDRAPDEVRRMLAVERVMTKPFRIGELVSAVQELLRAGAAPAPRPA